MPFRHYLIQNSTICCHTAMCYLVKIPNPLAGVLPTPESQGGKHFHVLPCYRMLQSATLLPQIINPMVGWCQWYSAMQCNSMPMGHIAREVEDTQGCQRGNESMGWYAPSVVQFYNALCNFIILQFNVGNIYCVVKCYACSMNSVSLFTSREQIALRETR